MSIQYCNYCNRKIDTDFDAEHEDICEDNPENQEEYTGPEECDDIYDIDEKY